MPESALRKNRDADEGRVASGQSRDLTAERKLAHVDRRVAQRAVERPRCIAFEREPDAFRHDIATGDRHQEIVVLRDHLQLDSILHDFPFGCYPLFAPAAWRSLRAVSISRRRTAPNSSGVLPT